MGGWSWKDLGIRPLVFPVLALGLGCVLPELARPAPRTVACLAAVLALAGLGLRAFPGAHLSLLVSAALAARAERATVLPTGTPVVLEGRLASATVDARGGAGVLEVARANGAPAR